jgi:hypothetical protein
MCVAIALYEHGRDSAAATVSITPGSWSRKERPMVLSKEFLAAWFLSSTVTDVKKSNGVPGYIQVDLVQVRPTSVKELTNCVRGSRKIGNDYATIRVLGKGIE